MAGIHSDCSTREIIILINELSGVIAANDEPIIHNQRTSWLLRSIQLPICLPQNNTRDKIGLWRCDIVVSGVRRMNEVTQRWAQFVLGWVTVFGQIYHLRV